MRQAKELIAAADSLIELFERLARDPRQGVIGDVAEALGDAKLTARELFGMAMLLLIAGLETTVNLIGNAVISLLRNPSQWSLLRADGGLAGHRIKAGQMVGVLIAAANRDASVFADPHRFDITRTGTPEHLAFSSGIHYCPVHWRPATGLRGAPLPPRQRGLAEVWGGGARGEDLVHVVLRPGLEGGEHGEQ
ncbi:cytochrome P450 [Allokutzneria sp. A3M-2-11 16]|uniref:cytochrome P450 n=1 Tax=Allokutzneria sp. A3M-2-11 16 TaxID=2962043 RepID=UPI0020B64D32|nr:cytochrome P450 [Allokutzneria sp. A3M-2-11 16]MCP3802111.1 cytochrome P450 [Allokutzneria sp. A3M-2-11 16]